MLRAGAAAAAKDEASVGKRTSASSANTSITPGISDNTDVSKARRNNNNYYALIAAIITCLIVIGDLEFNSNKINIQSILHSFIGKHPAGSAPPPPDACFREGIEYFQVYHISKCGGTNMRRVLTKIFNVSTEARSEDVGWWVRERENFPDHRYNRDVNSTLKKKTFIIGLVRNPFSYYTSLYGMLLGWSYPECKRFIRNNGTKGGGLRGCNCGMRRAFVNGKAHLFRESNRNNVSAFAEWLELVLTDDRPRLQYFTTPEQTSRCAERMQYRHDNLMRMGDGSMAYDAVVRQEQYYPSLRRSLEKVRPCAPANVTIYFDALDQFEMSGRAIGTREAFSTGKRRGAQKATTKPMPDHCYYSPRLRKLVEDSDAEYMERYGYTWENFIGANVSGEEEDACARYIDSK